MSEEVNHPAHYNNESIKIETIEIIDLLTDRASFSIGNAIKYICRAPYKKDSPFKVHLEKALWYLNDYDYNKNVKEIKNKKLSKFEMDQLLKITRRLSQGNTEENICGELLNLLISDITFFEGCITMTKSKLKSYLKELNA